MCLNSNQREHKGIRWRALLTTSWSCRRRPRRKWASFVTPTRVREPFRGGLRRQIWTLMLIFRLARNRPRRGLIRRSDRVSREWWRWWVLRIVGMAPRSNLIRLISFSIRMRANITQKFTRKFRTKKNKLSSIWSLKLILPSHNNSVSQFTKTQWAPKVITVEKSSKGAWYQPKTFTRSASSIFTVNAKRRSVEALSNSAPRTKWCTVRTTTWTHSTVVIRCWNRKSHHRMRPQSLKHRTKSTKTTQNSAKGRKMRWLAISLSSFVCRLQRGFYRIRRLWTRRYWRITDMLRKLAGKRHCLSRWWRMLWRRDLLRLNRLSPILLLLSLYHRRATPN